MKPKRLIDTVVKADSGKRIMLVAVSCILAAIAVACCMFTCSSASDYGDGTSTQSSMQSGTAAITDSSNGTSQGDGVLTSLETQDAEDVAPSSSASSNMPSPNSIDAAQRQSGDSSNQTETVSSGASNANTDVAISVPEKVWVVDYAQIWVEDAGAWDEQTPVYGYVEKSVCNICGAEITGNEAAHGKAHMLAGEGSGHHTEVSQVVTGYSTTHHDAVGHYETVESGGHWK